MKKLKYFFLLLLCSLGIIQVQAGYNYPYNCDTSWCYSTNFGELNPSGAGYFLTDVTTIDSSGFTVYMNTQLQKYINYYGTDTFTIADFYSGSGSAYDKSFTLSSLLAYNTTFYIGKPASQTYINGRDYLFSNFTAIINMLHVGYPIGDKKNKLSNLLSNIVSYDSNTNKFAIRNVCGDDTCTDSNYRLIPYNSIYDYKFLNGTLKPNSEFVVDNFKVAEDYTVSDYFLKAGESLKFNFGFTDYLDVSAASTSYKYTISYKYEGEAPVDFLTETINVSKTFGVSSPNIDAAHIGDVVDLTILSTSLKKIRVGITEGISLTKPGKITFYLTVQNLNTGDKFDKSQVNFAPVVVLPSDNVQSGTAHIDSSFSKALNDSGFNIGDTFSVSLSLKDLYGNEHYDYIDGYDISLTSGSSSDIELAKAGSNIYSTTLVGVKTNETSPYYVTFKFRIKSSGYHALTGFNVKVREKKTNYIYTTTPTYYTITDIFPSNMYDGVKKMKIYIKSPLISDFNISCSKGPIVLRTTCTSDNFSGCNPSMNQSVTFNSQSQNGSMGVLSIKDYAYNVKNYNYTMNHLDQTPPTISVFKEMVPLTASNYSYKGNDDDFLVKFYEWTTSNCTARIHYLVQVNGTTLFNSIENSSSLDLIIPNFLKTKGSKTLYIKATDDYGNYSEKTMTFQIYPNIVSSSDTLLSVDNTGDKYADNIDNYTYTLYLKDKYGNAISDKNIDLIDQSCLGAPSSCKTIVTNMVDISGSDALQEYNYASKTDINGKITFKIKSLSPGLFTQRFKLEMNSWDDNYADIATKYTTYKQLGTDINSFKKPFYGTLLASKNGTDYTIKPEIGTELFYRILIQSISSVASINIQLDDYKMFINPVDIANTTIQGLSNIDNLDSKIQNFKARIDTSANATGLGQPGVKIGNASNLTPIQISYILGGENIRYYLSEDDLGDSRKMLSIDNTKDSFLGVKVIGNLQGNGKQTVTGQRANFSDISKTDIRATIRKTAFAYVKNMTSNSTLKGVKYVVGDVSISGVQDYETLVVKDGNVKITGNISPSGTYKKLGIIVLKDNYKIETGYAGKGNVYVTPDVTQINAVIYADGGFISADSTGNPYTSDSTTRSNALSKQLIVNGTLFTRNTIGGATLAGGSYIFPGGSAASTFNTAMIYDLNYIRRGNDGCDKNANALCSDPGEYKDVFVIKYDSKVQLSPPKLFK